MEFYAIVNKENGVVENTILWDGLPEWLPPDGCEAIKTDGVAIGWIYSSGKFSPPPEIPPSAAEIIQLNKIQKNNLMANAASAMKPLEFAKELGESTAEEDKQLVTWKKYILSVSRIDPEVLQPEWPQWPGV